tara:strand:+ start:1373 stop:1591 length:219 start_codon:yes stop_codon:yes gene_type:complete
MKTIELTDEERSAVIQLIDLAIQNPAGGGLKIAGVANFLAGKFADAPAEQGPSNLEPVEVVEGFDGGGKPLE